jgi:cytochrome oxidase Cu insertion factor (SCO1/SenC/PrrC family)
MRIATLICAGAMLVLAGFETFGEARIRFVDRALVDTKGASVRFVRDVIARKATVISFTYLGCAAQCPAIDLTIDEVVGRLGGGAPDAPQFVTLTIDPFNDRPDRLAERADAMHPARRFLSGEPLEVVTVLDALGMTFGRIEDHELVVLVVARGGRTVRRLSGLSTAVEIAAAIEAVR